MLDKKDPPTISPLEVALSEDLDFLHKAGLKVARSKNLLDQAGLSEVYDLARVALAVMTKAAIAKANKTPVRMPDLKTSRTRITLQVLFTRELAIIKKRVQESFCDAGMLKREYPDFEVWNQLSSSEIREIARGEDFRPKAYAGNIVLRMFGLTNLETLRKDRKKLKKASQK
jgi:hypothetical protein